MDGNKTECQPQCKLYYEIKYGQQCAERIDHPPFWDEEG